MAEGIEFKLVVRDDGTVTLKKFNDQLDRTEKESKQASRGIKTLSKGLGSLKGKLIGVASIGAFALLTKDIIQTGATFERTMKEVGGVSRTIIGGEITPMFREMEALARQMGEQTEYSATQAGEALRFLTMAGISARDSMQALPGVLDLATVSGLDLGRVADIASNAMTAMGLSAEDLGRINDSLVNTTTRSNSTVDMLAESFKYVAPTAKAVGLEIEELNAFLGKLHDAGIQGSMAGTQLNMGLVKMIELQGRLGMEGTPVIEMLQKIKDENWSLNRILDEFAGRGGRAILILKDMIPEIKALTEAQRENRGASTELAKVYRDTVKGALMELSSVVESLKLDVFSGELGNLKGTIQGFTKTLRDNRESIVAFGEGILTIFTGFTKLVSIGGSVTSVISNVAGAMGEASVTGEDLATALARISDPKGTEGLSEEYLKLEDSIRRVSDRTTKLREMQRKAKKGESLGLIVDATIGTGAKAVKHLESAIQSLNGEMDKLLDKREDLEKKEGFDPDALIPPEQIKANLEALTKLGGEMSSISERTAKLKEKQVALAEALRKPLEVAIKGKTEWDKFIASMSTEKIEQIYKKIQAGENITFDFISPEKIKETIDKIEKEGADIKLEADLKLKMDLQEELTQDPSAVIAKLKEAYKALVKAQKEFVKEEDKAEKERKRRAKEQQKENERLLAEVEKVYEGLFEAFAQAEKELLARSKQLWGSYASIVSGSLNNAFDTIAKGKDFSFTDMFEDLGEGIGLKLGKQIGMDMGGSIKKSLMDSGIFDQLSMQQAEFMSGALGSIGGMAISAGAGIFAEGVMTSLSGNTRVSQLREQQIKQMEENTKALKENTKNLDLRAKQARGEAVSPLTPEIEDFVKQWQETFTSTTLALSQRLAPEVITGETQLVMPDIGGGRFGGASSIDAGGVRQAEVDIDAMTREIPIQEWLDQIEAGTIGIEEAIATLKASGGGQTVRTFVTALEDLEKDFDSGFKSFQDIMTADIQSFTDSIISPQNELQQSLQNATTNFDEFFAGLTEIETNLGINLDSIRNEWTETQQDVFDAIRKQFREQRKATLQQGRMLVEDIAGTADPLERALTDVNGSFDQLRETLINQGGTSQDLYKLELQRQQAMVLTAKAHQDNIDNLLKEAQAYGQTETALQKVDSDFDNLRESLVQAGATVEELAMLEAHRTQALKDQRQELSEGLREPFRDIFKDIQFRQSGQTEAQFLTRQFRSQVAGATTFEDLSGASGLIDQIYNSYINAMGEGTSSQEKIIEAQMKVADIYNQASEKAKALFESVEKAQRSLRFSALNVAVPREQLREAQRDYNTLLQRALTGDEDAINEFNSFASTYLELAQKDLKSSQEYVDLFDKVLADMDRVKANIDESQFIDRRQLAVAEQQLQEMRNNNASQINSLDMVRAEITKLYELMDERIQFVEVTEPVDNPDDIGGNIGELDVPGLQGGGVFTAPEGGTPVLLHGKEVVAPFSDFMRAMGGSDRNITLNLTVDMKDAVYTYNDIASIADDNRVRADRRGKAGKPIRMKRVVGDN